MASNHSLSNHSQKRFLFLWNSSFHSKQNTDIYKKEEEEEEEKKEPTIIGIDSNDIKDIISRTV